MKLLFDENLSPKLPRLFAAKFPGSVHVRDCGMKGFTDEDIWEFARAHNFVIVSKDSDFYKRSVLYSHPPKFIWLCLGNCSRDDLVNLLNAHEKEIFTFETSAESALVLA
jgi:predicted nuclease of predicted toxin-antitoxin system